MEEQQGNNNQEHSINIKSSENPPSSNNTTGTPQTNGNSIDRHTIHHEPITVIIQPNQQQDANAVAANKLSAENNRIGRRANRINLVAVFANAILIGFTFYLWQEAHTQNRTASNALTLSQRQFDSTLEAARITKIEQAKKDSEDAVNRRKQFILDSTSTQAQIGALKESQKQFQIANEPYLEIKVKSYDTITTNAPFTQIMQLHYEFRNLGNYPVQVISSQEGVKILDAPPSDHVMKTDTLFKSNIVNIWVTHDAPFTNSVLFNISNNDIEQFAKQRKLIYYWGTIRYKNLISKDVKKYIYLVEAYGWGGFSYLINDNVPDTN